jgi:hypothetical protein
MGRTMVAMAATSRPYYCNLNALTHYLPEIGFMETKN